MRPLGQIANYELCYAVEQKDADQASVTPGQLTEYTPDTPIVKLSVRGFSVIMYETGRSGEKVVSGEAS